MLTKRSVQGLGQVGLQVALILQPNREGYRALSHQRAGPLLGRVVAAVRQLRQNEKGFGWSDACRGWKQLQGFGKARAFRVTAVQFDAHDGSEVLHLFSRQRMLRVT